MSAPLAVVRSVLCLALMGCAAGCGQAGSSGDAADKESAAVPVAPTAVLYGRVVGSDHQAALPPDWQVRITAEYEDGTEVTPRDRDSSGELFAFKVVPGKRVRLYFEAVPYQASVTEYLDGHTSMIRRDPVGVVASIAPWNYPLYMAAWKLGPALATGNTVVLKPSARTPLSALRFAELVADQLPDVEGCRRS